MKRQIIFSLSIVIIFFSFLLIGCGSKTKKIDGFIGKVAKIENGNTFVLDNGLKVHVLGVADNTETQNYMNSYVLGQTVQLKPDFKNSKPKNFKKTNSDVWAYVRVKEPNKTTLLNGYLIKTRLSPYVSSFVSDSAQVFAEYSKHIHPFEKMDFPTLKSKMVPATFQIRTVDASGRKSLGTGFFITEDGLALTNNHVLDGTENSVLVLLTSAEGRIDENRVRGVYRILGTNPQLDFTVFQVQLDPGEKVPYLYLDYQQAVVPDEVGVVGNPRGLDAVFTTGRVTQIYNENGKIQIDANIAPGNSGGPVCNLYGAVTGIAQSVGTDGDGQISTGNLNFCVDIMRVRPYLDSHSDISTYAGK